MREPAVDKHELLRELKAQLSAELERGRRRALDAAEGATHEENRAEGDKDMRATEASYVARGQAQRVQELDAALTRLNAMPILEFAADARIQCSAVVLLEHAGRRTRYFLVSAAGGHKLLCTGAEIQTLTTQSPLGSALLGLSVGDEAELEGAGAPRVYRVLDVS